MSSDQHKTKSPDFVKCLAEFFQRDLVSIPLINKHYFQQFSQRSGVRTASLELDTAAFPNIEYIAGNRLSIWPLNPADQVSSIMKHLVDDLHPPHHASASPSIVTGSNIHGSSKRHRAQASPSPSAKQGKLDTAKSSKTGSTLDSPSRSAIIAGGARLSHPWSKFIHLNGKDSLRLALIYLYDIMMAPSRDLLRIMADSCSNKDHKAKLIALSKSDDAWERWICQGLRTLKSTFDEFNSCKLSAKTLFSELTLQQPRQYSISSIKSNKRFRTEIIVIQHRFNCRQIAFSLQNAKEREQLMLQDSAGNPVRSPNVLGQMQTHPTTVHVNHNDTASKKSSASVRSIRSMIAFSTSPISTQQVQKVPTFSGPLMSLYAAASLANTSDSAISGNSIGSHTSNNSMLRDARSIVSMGVPVPHDNSSSQSTDRSFEGLCSSYLLSLNTNDLIVCEFVENPRFTLKGNRERPILMIGQDIGVVAFRPFWQQRALEYDRAQMFYTLFKDLSPKKFGDMQLVCLTGNKFKVEDLFKSEMDSVLTNKILSSVTHLNRKLLANLLEHAATQSSGAIGVSGNNTSRGAANRRGSANKATMKLQIESKELIELGDRIFRLLVENNGCLYTCCDAQMTQALEILLVESILRHSNGKLSRERIMTALMPKWKGRRTTAALIGQQQQPLQPVTSTNQFLFTLENPFERAQIVQEIYDSSI